MKMYVDENQRYAETKSTGYSFVLVAVLGLILLGLLWAGVLPINIPFANKIMITVVMGILFSVFLAVGIKSFLALGRIKNNAKEQDSNQEEAINWFLEEYKDQVIVQFDSTDDDEENYFQRYDFIFNRIKEKYGDFSEEIIDHISEEIYNKIYEDKE